MIQKIKDWYAFQDLGGKICAPILILVVAFLIVFSFIRNPDGANPRLARMETKYFTVISHSLKFRLINDGDRLWKDKMIMQQCIDYYAERVFRWLLQSNAGYHIDERGLVKKFIIAFYEDEDEMKNAYTEQSNNFAIHHYDYLPYPLEAKGFAWQYEPRFLFITIVSANLYKINDPKAKAKALSLIELYKLFDIFKNWDLLGVDK